MNREIEALNSLEFERSVQALKDSLAGICAHFARLASELKALAEAASNAQRAV